MSASKDRGRTWREPKHINDDPAGNGKHQYLPKLSVATGGRLDAIFYDRRNDPGNVNNEVFFTSSTDQGMTFTRNSKVSGRGFSSRIGARYAGAAAKGQFDFGGRLGLLSTRWGALAVWTDTRHALVPPAQELFARSIRPGAA